MSSPILTRRSFIGTVAGGMAALSAAEENREQREGPVSQQPNILFLMTDQQRFDTIASLGNTDIYTPNLDRLVQRGLSFTRAYSTCPVCVPSRYTIRTGRREPTTGIYANMQPDLVPDQPENMEERCGPYLAQTLRSRGYRTFGIGKFHTTPWDEDLGYDTHLHSEELYGTPDQRRRDDYAAFIAREHPEYDFIEGLMGERTEMYYMPQMSPMPVQAGVEAWAADNAVKQIQTPGTQPYFGFVSFVGPHPPLAPPIPFNRMYDPDRMPNPVRGGLDIDHMDEQIPWMNHAIWAEDINDSHARVLRARYYGEISYIDQCIGKILDAVEARGDGNNTLICFFADHGDHLGDHHAWQKESYFEAACHVPYLVSWPKRLPGNVRRDELVCLTDLFAIATAASGIVEPRDGMDILGMTEGRVPPRDTLIAFYGTPGTPRFKVMVRSGDWKYIYMANGGRELLFNVTEDPGELSQRLESEPVVTSQLRSMAVAALHQPNADRALENGRLKAFPFEARPLIRIYQFDRSRGVTGFPEKPEDVLGRQP